MNRSNDNPDPQIGLDHGTMASRVLRILPPLGFVLAMAAIEEFWPEFLNWLGLTLHTDHANHLHRAIDVLFWMGIALLVSRSLTLFVWEGWIRHRTGHPVPRLLEDLTSGIVWIVAFSIIAGSVFDLPLSGLVTTSGVAIAIIGFALRGMISDIFTGIAIGVERPINPGDWIEVDGHPPGRVIDMNWRATRILTLDEVMVVVPNSQLGVQAFRNYSQPKRFYRVAAEFTLDYRVPAAQAERVLLAAVREIPELRSIPRSPDVMAGEFTERGIKWLMRFWIADVKRERQIVNQVLRNVQRNLNFAGLDVPAQRVELSRPAHIAAWDDEEGAKRQFVTGIGLFDALQEDEIKRITDRIKSTFCKTGQAVVTQDEPGQSLFIIKEGVLNVVIRDGSGTESVVGQLSAGSFFGEMSLLTGANRAATVVPALDSVVYEITKDEIEPMLKARPNLVEFLSRTLAERQMANQNRQDQSQRDKESATASLSQHLFDRISHFFHIGH